MCTLHITTGANYFVSASFIRFVNENFESEKHLFLIIDNINNVPTELIDYNNVIILEKNNKNYRNNLFNYMIKADKILLHSLSLDINYLLIMLFKPNIFEKLYWIAWGMDLYQWKREKKGIVYKIKNVVGFRFRKKIKHFVGIFPPDIDVFLKKFNSKASTHYASYVGNLYNLIYKEEINSKSISEKVSDNKTINILIGHSSTKILNHLKVFDTLKKYKDKDINIYIPLSYGDKSYGDMVQDKANEIFGHKAFVIRELLSELEYMEFLSTIDIAIFNTERQIGLGNISPLLYMDKKIFMPINSVMYKFYKSQKIDIWDYNGISELTYSEFIKPIRYKGGKNYIQNNELNLNRKIQSWADIFNE